MWSPLKKIFANSNLLGSSLGEVIFETRQLTGQWSGSLFQWRIKRGLDEKSFFISLVLKPDSYAGFEGSVKNYISFNIATAEQARADLDRCITEYHRLAGSHKASALPAESSVEL